MRYKLKPITLYPNYFITWDAEAVLSATFGVKLTRA